MAAVPLKPAYGPTLGQLLAPPLRRLPAALRSLVLASGVALVVLLAWLVLALLPARIVHHGSPAFHFSYRGLYRTAPDPGGYAKVSRSRHGLVEDSFAVAPLTLPPYQGSLSGELPLYAVRYIQELAQRRPGFQL